jgi:hypothetical protein
MTRVFVGGEGASELGGWAREAAYRGDSPEPGVLESLARKVADGDWVVVDAVCWKNIRKYQVGRADHNDVDNVLGVVLAAEEAGCEVVIFSRDDDGDPNTARAIVEGIARAVEAFDVDIVGAACRPCVEGWVLAIGGRPGTERLTSSRAKSDARADGLGVTADYVAAIEAADIGPAPRYPRIAADAETLRAFLEQAVSMLRAP